MQLEDLVNEQQFVNWMAMSTVSNARSLGKIAAHLSRGGGKLLVASDYKAAIETSNETVYDRYLQRNVSYTAVGWLSGALRPGWIGG